jgi:hypothetical protein
MMRRRRGMARATATSVSRRYWIGCTNSKIIATTST